jgi:CubicO group peptidase (beta-lactamase class C family)
MIKSAGMLRKYSFAVLILLSSWLSLFAQSPTDKKSFEELEKYLNTLENKDFSGVILVSKDNRVLLSKSLGLANREQKTPVTAKTVFEIGSTSKQFTAFAVVDLAVNSKLAFSDNLDKFFENVPADKKGITIHHLLTHSSGLEMYVDKNGPLEKFDRAAALKRIFKQKLKFTPGEKYDYSNSGYVLLGLIVEKVTGRDFKLYIKNLLSAKAQIKAGFYGDRDWERDAIACGYGFRTAGHPFDRGTISWGGLGTGYMLLDSEDYLKWMRFLTTDAALKIYGKYLFGEYYPYSSIDARAFYGYGWVTLYKTGEKIIYHNGGDTDLGYTSTVRYYAKKDIILVILSNNFSYEPHKIFEIKNKIEELFVFKQ